MSILASSMQADIGYLWEGRIDNYNKKNFIGVLNCQGLVNFGSGQYKKGYYFNGLL